MRASTSWWISFASARREVIELRLRSYRALNKAELAEVIRRALGGAA